MLLVGIFLLGLFGFVVAVLEAGEAADPERSPATSASLPATRSRPIARRWPAPRSRDGTGSVRHDRSRGRRRASRHARDAGSISTGTPTPSGVDAARAARSAAIVEQAMPVVPVVGFWSATRVGLAPRYRAGARDGPAGGHAPDRRRGRASTTPWRPPRHRPSIRTSSAATSGRSSGPFAGAAWASSPRPDLAPALRPLALDGRSLVGNERIRDVAELAARRSTLPVPAGEGWDQAETWVLVAGGDSFTDRGVYDTVVRKGRGVDYPVRQAAPRASPATAAATRSSTTTSCRATS